MVPSGSCHDTGCSDLVYNTALLAVAVCCCILPRSSPFRNSLLPFAPPPSCCMVLMRRTICSIKTRRLAEIVTADHAGLLTPRSIASSSGSVSSVEPTADTAVGSSSPVCEISGHGIQEALQLLARNALLPQKTVPPLLPLCNCPRSRGQRCCHTQLSAPKFV